MKKSTALKGKCCVLCGSTNDISLHHVYPLDKEQRNFKKGSQEELAKCVPLCNEHHVEIHKEPISHMVKRYSTRPCMCCGSKKKQGHIILHEKSHFKSFKDMMNQQNHVQKATIQKEILSSTSICTKCLLSAVNKKQTIQEYAKRVFPLLRMTVYLYHNGEWKRVKRINPYELQQKRLHTLAIRTKHTKPNKPKLKKYVQYETIHTRIECV